LCQHIQQLKRIFKTFGHGLKPRSRAAPWVVVQLAQDLSRCSDDRSGTLLSFRAGSEESFFSLDSSKLKLHHYLDT
jgi:hypothetical protein